jgi:hypothetical protein
LDPIAFDRERKAAADRLGIRVSTLTRLVEAKRAFLFLPSPPAPPPPPPPDAEDAAQACLDGINADNMVVIIGAKTRVLRFENMPIEAHGVRTVYRVPTIWSSRISATIT